MIATSWQRFNGEVNFGVIYTKGNQSTQYSLGSQAAYGFLRRILHYLDLDRPSAGRFRSLERSHID